MVRVRTRGKSLSRKELVDIVVKDEAVLTEDEALGHPRESPLIPPGAFPEHERFRSSRRMEEAGR